MNSWILLSAIVCWSPAWDTPLQCSLLVPDPERRIETRLSSTHDECVEAFVGEHYRRVSEQLPDGLVMYQSVECERAVKQSS